IGMGTAAVTAYLGVQSENPEAEFKVATVSRGGPADKAGIKVGDVIKAVNKKDIKTSQDLVSEIATKKVGDKVTLTVQHDQETKELIATLEPSPANVGRGGQPNVNLGFFATEEEDVLLVRRVQPDSGADKAGI